MLPVRGFEQGLRGEIKNNGLKQQLKQAVSQDIDIVVFKCFASPPLFISWLCHGDPPEDYLLANKHTL